MLIVLIIWWIIPAHAGSIIFARSMEAVDGDHPRSCGEYSMARHICSPSSGSSPLMRGVLRLLSSALILLGIIPAHAGSIRSSLGTDAWTGDHPRSCGEYCSRILYNRLYQGSSPLMRGVFAEEMHFDYYYGIIPAHAGSI